MPSASKACARMSPSWTTLPSGSIAVCPAHTSMLSPPVTSTACADPNWSCHVQGFTVRVSTSSSFMQISELRESTVGPFPQREDVMAEPTHQPDIDHRRLAVDLFNCVWTLLEKPERTREDDDEMVHAAHASRFHWGKAGTSAHRARGEWQCSRVYAVLRRSEPALHHARRCLELCEANRQEMEDWDMPFAYEALARAHAVAGNRRESSEYVTRARELGERIADEEDRQLLLNDLATVGT